MRTCYRASMLGFEWGAHFHPLDWGIAIQLLLTGELSFQLGPFSLWIGVRQ